MKRITSAEEFQLSDIKEVDNQCGVFEIKAQSKDRWYNLSFGSGDIMPNCECLDFGRNGLPCKHFFAVFNHFPEWQWDSLPKKYRENPHISLDQDLLFSCPLNDEHTAYEETSRQPLKEIKQSKKVSNTPDTTEVTIRQEQMKCREVLKELTSLTYNVYDLQALENLTTGLKPLLYNFERNQLTDEKENFETENKEVAKDTNNKICIENKDISNVKQKEKVCCSKPDKKYLSLPVRQKKNRYNKRSGAHASMMRKHYKIDLSVDDDFEPKKKKKKSQPKKSCILPQETTTISYHSNQQRQLDVKDTKSKGNIPRFTQIPDTIAKETSMDLETFAQFACPHDQSHFTNISQLTENKFSEESVVSTNLSIESSPYITIDENSPDPVVWTSIENSYDTGDEVPLVLYSTTKPRLLDKHTWLNNTDICAGQALLKNKFPNIEGLRDPSKYCLEVAPAKSPFIQLLNTGGHWVCCTTISTKPNSGTVRVLDSLYNRPSSHVVEHSCCLLRHSGSTMTFLNEKVQKQIGVSECGLFALAFATDLCYGLDPANQHYDQTTMRQHYVSCLESKAIVPFPKTTKRVPCHATCIKTQVDIFCICRQPDDHLQYVQCFRCQEWYHPTCADIPTTVINSKKRWRCRKCLVSPA